MASLAFNILALQEYATSTTMTSEHGAFPSGNTVSVKMIDLCDIEGVPCSYLHAPPIDGVDLLPSAPSLCFLIEHGTGRRVMFDLGVPKRLQSLGPVVSEDLRQHGFNISVQSDAAEYLQDHGVPVQSIEAVIWSHSHWDHKGDMSQFPGSTDLVLGPGSVKAFLDGDGNSAVGGVNTTDIKERRVWEVDFDTAPMFKIGRFRAFDYFKDGSLYLLDSPGHEIGHLSALVRTTNNPDTFVLLGGDFAHHCGEFRPSKSLRVPRDLPSTQHSGHSTQGTSPKIWIEETNKLRGRASDQSLYDPKWAHDMHKALTSIGHVQGLDFDENVLVLIAHDRSVRSSDLPSFPQELNDWKRLAVKETMMWSWVQDMLDACGQHQSVGSAEGKSTE